nr:pyridoxal-phosphate dependent enzyme [Arthrobacter sp. JCM 19049]
MNEELSEGAHWVREAIALLDADANRSADTHLHVFPLPAQWGIDLYLKDESVHPTGSLKHRLARSLILYGLVNGHIGKDTTLVEASSGSTAVSEAYFARMLGLPFIAVVPHGTSSEKVELIEFYGGHCHFVDGPAAVYQSARELAAESNGTTWTSSPTPNGPPTGGATTTSPNRCSPRCPPNATRFPPGS